MSTGKFQTPFDLLNASRLVYLYAGPIGPVRWGGLTIGTDITNDAGVDDPGSFWGP